LVIFTSSTLPAIILLAVIINSSSRSKVDTQIMFHKKLSYSKAAADRL
jgi:hypothetical protein